VTVEAAPLMPAPRRRWRVAFAREPVDRRDRFLYHKTTHRAVYEAARAALPGMDDVILWNAEGEVTEATIANVVVRWHGELVTPPIACGLLAGTYRAHLLEQGRIREGVLTLQDVRQADALYLINSVRGWIPASLAEPALP
jgi:branched-subunit amino acid aminotransferase/4-amino-4-deoxychorismate lyase